MKSVMLKSTIHAHTLAHPLATTGWSGAALNYAVDNIPDNITPAQVLRAADTSCIMWAGVGSCYRVDYAQLGLGRIIWPDGRPAPRAPLIPA
jgi:hypothetical protein